MYTEYYPCSDAEEELPRKVNVPDDFLAYIGSSAKNLPIRVFEDPESLRPDLQSIRVSIFGLVLPYFCFLRNAMNL